LETDFDFDWENQLGRVEQFGAVEIDSLVFYLEALNQFAPVVVTGRVAPNEDCRLSLIAVGSVEESTGFDVCHGWRLRDADCPHLLDIARSISGLMLSLKVRSRQHCNRNFGILGGT
jgi:hypothetical protein